MLRSIVVLTSCQTGLETYYIIHSIFGKNIATMNRCIKLSVSILAFLFLFFTFAFIRRVKWKLEHFRY